MAQQLPWTQWLSTFVLPSFGLPSSLPRLFPVGMCTAYRKSDVAVENSMMVSAGLHFGFYRNQSEVEVEQVIY